MAVLKNGETNGKLGNTVTYQLLNKTVTRTIGINDNPPTTAQLANRLGITLGNAFMKPIKAFIKVSFKTVAAHNGMYPHNRAMSNLKLHAMQGTYPDLSINYSKVLVAEGNLPMAENPVVEKTDDGLRFTWGKVKTFPRNIDQVMLMAYFPELSKAAYITAGAKRSAGEDILEIKPSLMNEKMEVYISFISEDRNAVSNSIYLGQI
jgi:hypothetical protein